MSFADVVAHLDSTETVAIVTRRAGGEPTATPIWAVVVDGVPYVRSYLGDGAYWYRHVRSGRPVAFSLGDGSVAENSKAAALQQPSAPVTVDHVPADDDIQSAIDDAFREKYAKYPKERDAMLTAKVVACTLRVLPA